MAEESAEDSVPGSSRPVGVSLSPEAPPAPPAPGGRAPSFGAPTDPDAWALQIGGRISAWGRVGIGRRTETNSTSDAGPPLHTPPHTVGPDPIYAGTAATLNFQYGNQTLRAHASYEVALTGPQWEGYHRVEKGPRLRTAYLTVTPAPIGKTRLRFQAGAFPAHYGAPGPWGWGTFGPVLAVHGYGGIAALEYDLTGNTLLTFEYGVSAVAEAEEDLVRGTYSDWPETGLSSIVNHAHAGVSFKNKYFAQLHFAHADGNNMRTFLDDDETTPTLERGPDGHLRVAALELRWVEDPYGQIGVTPVMWDMENAPALHDGIWWGIGWTAGGREMTDRYLGTDSEGTGRVAAVSAEYNFSVSRMLSYPEPFDGNGRDLRVKLAFLPHWTLKTDDPAHKDAKGYLLGTSVEHVLLSWLSTTYSLFGESRDTSVAGADAAYRRERWSAYNASLGFAVHSDWQSRDRIELAYSRYFYSDFTDNNPEQPLDREVFSLGASVAF